jgi:predicted enzyme related to lactoylglutathione lyase
MITHVKFVGIPVADQERALRFYTEKLGFEVLTDSPMGTQRWIELQCGRAETGVVLFTPEGQEDRVGSFFNGALATDDVVATHAELSQRGVEFTKPPEKAPWGTFATFKDSEGNLFVLSSR